MKSSQYRGNKRRCFPHLLYAPTFIKAIQVYGTGYQYVCSPLPSPSKILVPPHDCRSGTNCFAKVMTVKMRQNWFDFACCRVNIICNRNISSASIRSSRLAALLPINSFHFSFVLCEKHSPLKPNLSWCSSLPHN